MDFVSNQQKIKLAEAVVKKCIGRRGVWASPLRYKYQCWTRDFVIAAESYFLDSGGFAVVKTHPSELANREHSSGQMPFIY